MDSFARLLKSYDYDFPKSAVALEPAVPRDAAKLFVYDSATDKAAYDTFRGLGRHLPPRSCLVFNETKVIPARLKVIKETGGKAFLLYVRDVGPGRFEALCERSLAVGSNVRIAKKSLLVEAVSAGRYTLKIIGGGSPVALCRRYGLMPLPPYLKKTPLAEKDVREKYQTVFARRAGSVAAPTASLHFTPRLMRAVRAAGHDVVFVTLHVNLGTFLPLKPEQVTAGELHEEQYEISTSAAVKILAAKRSGRPVIAVGTTVVRALESAAVAKGIVKRGTTKLFIRPGYRFRVVDGLITNFHVPKSSLLMLVSAFIGREKLLVLYRKAINAGFKLFSFGDGMLVLPKMKPHLRRIRDPRTTRRGT